MTYSFDSVGNRTGKLFPEGERYTYSYNALNQPETTTDPSADITTSTYDSASQETLEELGAGTRASFVYNLAGQITGIGNLKSDDSVITTYEFEYNPIGNKTSLLENSGDRVTWSYDETSQLVSDERSGTAAYSIQFSYDPVGNRLSKTDSGAVTTSSYDAANQLESSTDSGGTTQYAFDDSGNQHLVTDPSGERTTTSWDFENQSTLVELPDGNRVTMEYNADYRRISKET